MNGITAITQYLNKKVLDDRIFDNEEYDRQFKKEMKELWNIIDTNPPMAEMALKEYHKGYVKAIKNKDKANELYNIHRFYFMFTYADWTKKWEPKTWDRINKEMGKDWKGILYDVKNK